MALMLKLYKIPDKTIFRIIFASIIFWNLKYFFLVFQIPYTMFFAPYLEKNSFYSQVNDIKTTTKEFSDFQDEGEISFICDIPEAKVFDIAESIKNFYIVQYAIVPSVLKNDTNNTYVIGVFSKKEKTPNGYKLQKQINKNTYLYKRID